MKVFVHVNMQEFFSSGGTPSNSTGGTKAKENLHLIYCDAGKIFSQRNALQIKLYMYSAAGKKIDEQAVSKKSNFVRLV